MLEELQKLLESLVDALERASKNVERIASMFLADLLDFLERTYKWLVDAIRRTKEYLRRLFTAIGRISVALGKLALFYSPIVVFLVAFAFTKGIVWLAASAVWFVLITAICLTYGKRAETHKEQIKPSSSDETETPLTSSAEDVDGSEGQKEYPH